MKTLSDFCLKYQDEKILKIQKRKSVKKKGLEVNESMGKAKRFKKRRK